ncbi:MAG: hypothetical protein M3N42_02415, partial [Cyanobacteriota bacterium]|nr:hypothetical protein [Cyanobacteriota bacterium]
MLLTNKLCILLNSQKKCGLPAKAASTAVSLLSMNILIETRPNNELKIRIQTPAFKRKLYTDKASDRKRIKKTAFLDELRSINKHIETSPRLPTNSQLIPVIDITPDGKPVRDFLDVARLKVRRLTLLDILKKSQRFSLVAPRWGKTNRKKSFTRNARRKILQAGAVMDQLYPGKAWMTTVTIPGGTPAALKAVADWSGWLVNRMLQYIRRHSIRKQAMWFYTWELQDRGALHMHWAVAHDDLKVGKEIAEHLEYYWFELLAELKEKIGVDCFERLEGGTHRNSSLHWQSNVQKVQKSVAAYFSKYCSKDSENVKRHKTYKPDQIYYPASWWNSSYSAKAAIKMGSFDYKLEHYTKEECEYTISMFWDYLEAMGITKTAEKYFEISIPHIPFPVCSGTVQLVYVKPENWLECRELIKSLCTKDDFIGEGKIVIEELAKHARKQLEN